MTPKAKTPVRQWWVIEDRAFEDIDDDEKNGYWGDVFTKHPQQGPLEWQSRFIHVVEHSAYLEALAKIELLEKELAKVKDVANDLLCDLRLYASPRRDMTGDLSKWKYIEVRHEADYEFYPNHITKEEIAAYEGALASLGKGGKE